MNGERIPGAKLLLFFVVQQGIFLAAGIGLWIWSGRDPGDLLSVASDDIVIGLVLTAGLIALTGTISALLPSLQDKMTRQMGRTLFATERPYGLAGILLLSLCAGIGEEMLFRAGIQTFAGDYMPGWAAVALATAIFAIAHPASGIFIAMIAGIGAIFGITYHLTGSLPGVILAHALLDVWACLFIQRRLRRMGHWDEQAAATATGTEGSASAP